MLLLSLSLLLCFINNPFLRTTGGVEMFLSVGGTPEWPRRFNYLT